MNELTAQAEKHKVFIETYGCQMNLADSEIVAAVVKSGGYDLTDSIDTADVIFLNTCSVRDNAEKTIFNRLEHLRYYKKRNRKLIVGILGCMAERLRGKLIGKQDLVGIVVGPDEYRKLPDLLDNAMNGEQGIAVKLSRVETYDDILPLRTEGISAWISIMRGCDKFCTYCIVPFTRGRERSRPKGSIIDETKRLYDQGIKEITLLGQNVNSYNDTDGGNDFSDLLKSCAVAVPGMRIRYTTSHPYDMSDKLIETMAEYENICNYIHLPVQSGSDKVLQEMNRQYSVEQYINRIDKIRHFLPDCSLSTDIITGFPNETIEDHQATLALMKRVRYDGAYMFKYSPRENTKAWRMEDNIPEEEKSRRLNQIIEIQQLVAKELNEEQHGKKFEILVEGESKKNDQEWMGRTCTNKVVIFPIKQGIAIGDKVNVRVVSSNSATLFGELM
jgi:tRNA-2-methylthio-N6-dimethylallyladenosine synthase